MHSSVVFVPPQANFGFPSKTPHFACIIQTPVSRRGEIRVTSQLYPIWDIEIPLDWADGGERIPGSLYQYLLGMWLSMSGQLSDFLYTDPNDNTIGSSEGPQQFATGDGTTTVFQLVRPIGIGYDIVQNLNGTPVLYSQPASGGTPTLISSSAYTIDSQGVVTFTTAPASGVILSWTGSWYYRVRFSDDSVTFEQMMSNLWESKALKLTSVIL